jgi:hypothetical protein
MCKNDEIKASPGVNSETPATDSSTGTYKMLAAGLGVTTIAFMIATIVLAVDKDSAAPVPVSVEEGVVYSNVPDNTFFDTPTIFDAGENTCKGKNPKFENVDCVHLRGPQAGSNVTKGYVGGMNVSLVPNTKNYWQSSMCPVNVHWHLGTEHYSVGEYDEQGNGPFGNIMLEEDMETEDNVRKLASEVRAGFRCSYYDAADTKFTTEYDWQHCKGMHVGETYEVHWPHSAAGACGTINQYQTPFYDGVFCNLDLETFTTLSAQDVANAVGVQAQIYTIVNDEAYYYPDMIRGWIVDEKTGMGQDIHYYTGSTTGTSRNNEICSQYAPITWQVDRKCHMISASSFDMLCYEMKLQRDDMSDDLHAHGSRLLVNDTYVANNQQRRRLSGLHDHAHDEHNHVHDGEHDHSHVHDHSHLRAQSHSHGHGHDHSHQDWY